MLIEVFHSSHLPCLIKADLPTAGFFIFHLPPPVVQKLVGSAPNNLNKCSCHDLVMVLFNIYCPFFLITILKIVNFPFVYITCFIKWIQFIVLIGMDLKSEVFVTTVLNESGIWSDRLIIFPMQNCTPRAICNKYSKPHIC